MQFYLNCFVKCNNVILHPCLNIIFVLHKCDLTAIIIVNQVAKEK